MPACATTFSTCRRSAPIATTCRRASASPGLRGVSRRTLVRGSAGLFFDRVPLRALANALLSANNTSDVANLRQISISLSPTQAGAPVFPGILAGPVPAVTLPNLTTMNPDMQNAYSRQGSVEVEQQIGERSTVSAGYQYTGGRSLDHLGQPERAGLCRRGNEQRLPAESDLRQQQPVLALRPSPAITACTSHSCSGRHDGATIASRTPTRRRCRTSATSSSARRSIPSISTRTGAARTTISATASSSTAP